MDFVFDQPAPKKQSLRVNVDHRVAARWPRTNERSRQVGYLIERALAEAVAPEVGDVRDDEQELHAKINLVALEQINALSAEAGQSPQAISTGLIKAILPQILAEFRAADDLAEVARAKDLERERAIEIRAHEIESAVNGPAVTTRERNGRIEISMPFSESAITLTKEIPGAKWDAKSRVWHISKHYEKRFQEIIKPIRKNIAREWAEREFELQQSGPSSLKKVKLKFAGGSILIKFPYNRMAVDYIRKFKKDGIVSWDESRSSWKSSWKNKIKAYRIAEKIDEILA